MPARISTPPAARSAWPWLPAVTRPGRIYVGPTGEAVRTNDDGTLDAIVFGGRPWHRSAASAPGAARAAAGAP